MAVSTSAIRLTDLALHSNSERERAIAYSLITHGNVLADIPIVTRPELNRIGGRFLQTSLPTPTWTALNAEPTVVGGNPVQFSEQCYVLRNAWQQDMFYRATDQGTSQAAQVELYLRSLTYDVNDKFINNNPVTGDQNCFAGIRYRLDNPTISGSETEMKVDAGAVDLREANMTAATANTFLNKLAQFVYNFGGGTGDEAGSDLVLYMNETMAIRFRQAIATVGAGVAWRTDRDNLGRTVSSFMGAMIKIIGRKSDGSTQIITSTEDSAGADGASGHTSIYGVRYGTTLGVSAWQIHGLGEALSEPKLLENGVTWQTVFNWAIGLWVTDTRSIGRLYGIRLS